MNLELEESGLSTKLFTPMKTGCCHTSITAAPTGSLLSAGILFADNLMRERKECLTGVGAVSQ